jgi:hypothetical protein
MASLLFASIGLIGVACVGLIAWRVAARRAASSTDLRHVTVSRAWLSHHQREDCS